MPGVLRGPKVAGLSLILTSVSLLLHTPKPSVAAVLLAEVRPEDVPDKSAGARSGVCAGVMSKWRLGALSSAGRSPRTHTTLTGPFFPSTHTGPRQPSLTMRLFGSSPRTLASLALPRTRRPVARVCVLRLCGWALLLSTTLLCGCRCSLSCVSVIHRHTIVFPLVEKGIPMTAPVISGTHELCLRPSSWIRGLA